MPDVPVMGEESRVSHTLDVILPGEALSIDALQDGCTTCHAEQINAAGMQALIDDVQASTRKRLEAARAHITEDCGPWIHDVLDFVEGDGSLGVHNYAYTDALLDAIEVATGLQPVSQEMTDVPLCVNAVIVDAEAVREEFTSRTPLGNLTESSVILLVIGIALILAALVTFALRFSKLWMRLVGLLALVLGVGLIVSAFALPNLEPTIHVTGEDGYCQMCHAADAEPFVLADGSSLPMAVDTTRLAASVHGDSYKDGRMGCIDCHGETAFPHTGLTPVSLSTHRLQASSLCIDCHPHDTAHYLDVLDHDVIVGCADCHSAHYVLPASELDPTLLQ
jgi:hypothetical protein